MGSDCNGYRFSLLGDENIVKLIVMRAVQLYEYTKSH
jgi:hypothetical protein